jgi:hypothetical protein
LAWLSLGAGIVCAAVVLVDIVAGKRQHMWIMNVVWPVTALYSGPLGLWTYFRIGRLSTSERVEQAHSLGEKPPGMRKPFWQIVAVGSTHCGAGCTLGDLCAECALIVAPLTLFGHRIFGAWVVDYLFAYVFGIAFQYFTIAPMRQLTVWQGLWAAVKADTLSLTAWQVGMYGWMAIATFAIFGHELSKSAPVFWFMMQIAMLAGFMTSYPINWWLLRTGLKEKM